MRTFLIRAYSRTLRRDTPRILAKRKNLFPPSPMSLLAAFPRSNTPHQKRLCCGACCYLYTKNSVARTTMGELAKECKFRMFSRCKREVKTERIEKFLWTFETKKFNFYSRGKWKNSKLLLLEIYLRECEAFPCRPRAK
jgi:hypothetical protein